MNSAFIKKLQPGLTGICASSLLLCLFGCLPIWAQTTLTAPPSRILPLNHMHFASGDLRVGGWLRVETAIGDDYFDGTSSLERVRRHFQIAHELGVKYLRCGFSWNAIEKSHGVFDWTFWDMLVQEAERAHVQILPYVAYTPRWAASVDEEFWSQPPRKDAWYSDFMYQAVSRYRGRVHSWEIWNEPDNPEYWKGSAEAYSRLVSAAAIHMREADPSIVLVLGGMSRGPSPFFTELMHKFRIGEYVDVIAVHGYPETWGPERVERIYQDWIPQMSELIRNESSGLDFWANELGYADFRFAPTQASKWGGSVFYNYEHTSAYAATFLFKSEVMALASGRVSLAGWYRIDDFGLDTPHVSTDEVNFHLGLVDINGHPKPAFYALQFFNELFNQSVQRVDAQVSRPAGSQSDVELFRRKDGELVLIGWLRSSEPAEIHQSNGMAEDRREEEVSIKLPCRPAPHFRQYDAEGRSMRDHAFLTDNDFVQAKLRGDRVAVAVVNCQK